MFWNSSQRKKITFQDVFIFLKGSWQNGWTTVGWCGRQSWKGGNPQEIGGSSCPVITRWEVVLAIIFSFMVIVWLTYHCHCLSVIFIVIVRLSFRHHHCLRCRLLISLGKPQQLLQQSTPIITKITKRYSHQRNSSNFNIEATYAINSTLIWNHTTLQQTKLTSKSEALTFSFKNKTIQVTEASDCDLLVEVEPVRWELCIEFFWL